jgi:flagellar assembly protein FliH
MAQPSRDGKRRAGRFIKRDDRLMNHVAVGDFSFEEICVTDIAGFDNDDASIIHVRLHEPSAIAKTIKKHPSFDGKIIPMEGERQVIAPQDFTDDWKNANSEGSGRRKRFSKMDEPLELTDEGQKEFAQIFGGRKRSSEVVDSPNVEVASEGAQAPSGSLASDAGFFKINRDEIHQPEAASSESFIPLGTSTQKVEAGSPNAVEVAAVDDWKARREVEEEVARMASAARDEASKAGFEEGRKNGFDRGYEDGFKTGEEKGELGARQVASQFFGRAGELIKEFEALKSQILDNVQQNFFDLCQAMGEALLEREFDIHPEAFATIMRRAVAETVKGDQFTIRVNPETAEALAKAGVKDLDSHLAKDAGIQPWEFRLESQLSVVDVQAKKMIKSLLGQADVSLFKKDDKAG